VDSTEEGHAKRTEDVDLGFGCPAVLQGCRNGEEVFAGRKQGRKQRGRLVGCCLVVCGRGFADGKNNLLSTTWLWGETRKELGFDSGGRFEARRGRRGVHRHQGGVKWNCGSSWLDKTGLFNKCSPMSGKRKD
jgi:hypothetical protein